MYRLKMIHLFVYTYFVLTNVKLAKYVVIMLPTFSGILFNCNIHIDKGKQLVYNFKKAEVLRASFAAPFFIRGEII